MTAAFYEYIGFGKALAAAGGLNWDLKLDDSGRAIRGTGWDVSAAIKAPPPRTIIREFGRDKKFLKVLAELHPHSPAVSRDHLSESWVQLIKAFVCDELFAKKHTAPYISAAARALRCMATCASPEQPWNITADDVRRAIHVAKLVQPSGGLADFIGTITSRLFDGQHIAAAAPLYPLLSIQRRRTDRRASYTRAKEQLLGSLEKRKRAERLPEKRALWELARIVLTERPQSVLDAIRFAQLRILLICGLRVGEVVTLPVDWKRTREYFDIQGKPAGELGGHSTATLLRYFAEKQAEGKSSAVVLYENGQYVPKMFEDIVEETLCAVERITTPLRKTLNAQKRTGRLLPWFTSSELVPAWKLYPYLTGNPFWLDLDLEERDDFTRRYRESSFDGAIFNEVYERQIQLKGTRAFDRGFYVFFNRIKNGPSGLCFRRADGAPLDESNKMNWSRTYLQVSEVEQFLLASKKTKVSDTHTYKLENSKVVQSGEMLFLLPKRPLSEERNEGMCDLTRYFSVGTSGTGLLQYSLGGSKSTPSIFERYGNTEEDRSLSLNTHSLRHLQNTELFRLGVADSIITKRFGRRSIAQSYEYDHRSLQERLDQVELQGEWEEFLGDRAGSVAKMIEAGAASGPIVREFKRIQAAHGDEAAFTFLKAEADGFHATPYGTCVNSFTVDPCPKHLQCFSGCRHLTSTGLPEHKVNLEALDKKLAVAEAKAVATDTKSVGRTNQIIEIRKIRDGVQKTLAAAPGAAVFPNGQDLSAPAVKREA